MRHLKKHSLFLVEGEKPVVYGVLGIASELADMTAAPPNMVETTLLPFGDKIIYDSLLMDYPVHFGGGISARFKQELRDAQERNGIITTLDKQQQKQASVDTIIDGNKKILKAFHTSLTKDGLSEKMQHEHGINIDRFVNAWFDNAKPPRSILDIRIKDVQQYIDSREHTNLVSFKRFSRFLRNTERIDWDTACALDELLKGC